MPPHRSSSSAPSLLSPDSFLPSHSLLLHTDPSASPRHRPASGRACSRRENKPACAWRAWRGRRRGRPPWPRRRSAAARTRTSGRRSGRPRGCFAAPALLARLPGGGRGPRRGRRTTSSPRERGGGEKEREKGKEKRVKSLALFSEKKASNPKRRKTSAAFSNSAQKMPSALVTGGGAGIGAATAIRLAERGYSVTVRRGSELS